jgi:hypothetical protein
MRCLGRSLARRQTRSQASGQGQTLSNARANQREPSLVGSRSKTRDRRSGPEVDVVDVMKESFSDQRVKRFGDVALVKGPEAPSLRQRDRDSGVILELATDSSEQTSVRHNLLSPIDVSRVEQDPAQCKVVKRGARVSGQGAPASWTCNQESSSSTPTPRR